MQGWFHADRFDLFLWFTSDLLTHLQICAGNDLAEWRSSGTLSTGQMTGRRGGGAGLRAAREDSVVTDSRVSPERLAHLLKVLGTIELPTEIREYVHSILRQQTPVVPRQPLAGIVRTLKTIDGS